jgi:HK97 family phage prohead protease
MALKGMVPIRGIATNRNPFAPDARSTFMRQFGPRTFRDSLRAQNHKVQFWVSHYPWEKLSGITDIKVTETDRGLEFEATLNTNFEQAADVFLAMSHGWLNECSIQWIPRSEKLSRTPDGKPCWMIAAADLVEISLVPKGLVPGTSATLVDKSLIVSTVPARPKSYADCQRLARFLSRADHHLNLWTDAQKPVPPRELYVRDLPATKAALAKIGARRLQDRNIRDLRNYQKLVASGAVAVLDPTSGQMVRPDSYVIPGLSMWRTRSMCRV